MSNVSFILIDLPKKSGDQTSLIEEWQRAFSQHLQPNDLTRFSFLERSLNQLKVTQVTFDCIVSPANSYGIMDGGSVSLNPAVASYAKHCAPGLTSISRWLSPHKRIFMLLLASSRPLSEIAISASHHQVHVFSSQVSHQTIILARL